MKHPFQHVGTSQAARLVKALSSGYFRLDERSMQDLISAAHAYARMLRYHDSHVVTDPQQALSDNWAGFWEVENLTYMAILAALDTDQIRRDYESIDAAFGEALDAASGKKGKKSAGFEGQYFRQLLLFTQKTALQIEQHYLTLRDDIALKSELLRLIRRDNAFEYDPDDVEGAMHQLVGWHKAWDDELDASLYQPFRLTDGRWGIRNLDEYHCILPDSTLIDRDQIRGLFLRFFNILVVIKARAQQLFDAEMGRLEKPEDQDPRPLAPHIALFITFLNLFRHAQDSLNDIPQRHLDFYYDQVLGLERRPATPDHAYLIFTLAKEFNQELIEKGTPLLAGKDDNGQPIIFKTLEQWKVTKAEVAEVKNTRFDLEKGTYKAAPFANSGDGKGGAFSTGSVPAWRAFGDDERMPDGELGFAISSPQLLLKEGKRVIELSVNTNADAETLALFTQPDVFSIRISNAETVWSDPLPSIQESNPDDWKVRNNTSPSLENVKKNTFPNGFKVVNVNTFLTFRIFLAADFPAVERPEHPNFKFHNPVVSIALNLEHPEVIEHFKALKGVVLEETNIQIIIFNLLIPPFTIQTWVSGIKKNITLQNDFGTFDGTERFYPFGPVPERDAKFYLGSEEVFQKTLNEIQIDFEWVDKPVDDNRKEIPVTTYYAGYNDPENRLSGQVETRLLNGGDFLIPTQQPPVENE
ncbi:MAG: hypothetical protein IT269_06795, partial [Saprospiraceae bacterium]|nr:hypothetical protein [Saprospiraceae bacterium]